MPTGEQIAVSIAAGARELLDAERAGEGLAGLAARAGNLAALVECYLPVLVHRERANGTNWPEVAEATGISVAQARGRWTLARLARLCAPVQGTHACDAAAALDMRRHATGEGASQPARARLVEALSFLRRTSGMSLSTLQRNTALDMNDLKAVMCGERVPSWLETGLLAAALGAVPADMRHLWECAAGVEPELATMTSTTARLALRRATRGIYLAAGCPPPAVVAGTARTVSTEGVEEVLDGETPVLWTSLAAVVSALEGDVRTVHGLWRAAWGTAPQRRPATSAADPSVHPAVGSRPARRERR
ncbi:hypothetical protein [Actinacidiphila sp. bgisy144]|uniref:hypothetical protein n=1 Tax=Actinacidiphila sp. bgisy144 TaxID=3413791 RepID=UPI003EB7B8FF